MQGAFLDKDLTDWKNAKNRLCMIVDSQSGGNWDGSIRLGRKFIESASTLPFLPTKDFAREEKRFEQTFARAQAQVERSSPLYAAYLRLQEKVPRPIVGEIVALSGE